MAISFNEVPTNIRVPFVYVEFDNSNAVQGAAQMPYKLLVIGQRLVSGTVAALTPVRVTSAKQAQTYFGTASMLAAMCAAALSNSQTIEVWAIGLNDNGAGASAVGELAFTGPATAAGTLNLYIGGRRVQVGVTSGMTAAQLATAVAAAINAAAALPVTAAVDGEVTTQVNVTARHKGVAGNSIDLRVNYYDGDVLPAGITVAITAMAGGTANPDLGTVWAAIGDTQYNVIACPYTDASNLTALKAELADRWGPLRQSDGIAFSAAAGTHSDLGTLGDSQNSPHLSIVSAHGTPTPPYELAAAVAGVAAFYLQQDPARPLQTLPIAGVLPAAIADRFTLQENNLLLYDGISTTMVDADGVVRIQRMITTYKTNPQGAEDISYLDVETPATLSYLRYDFRNYILRKYPRHKLANDGTRFGAGQAVITPKIGKAEAIARFRVWELLGLVEGADQFKAGLIVERNANDPTRLDWLLPPDLVNQFRVGGVQVAFLL